MSTGEGVAPPERQEAWAEAGDGQEALLPEQVFKVYDNQVAASAQAAEQLLEAASQRAAEVSSSWGP